MLKTTLESPLSQNEHKPKTNNQLPFQYYEYYEYYDILCLLTTSGAPTSKGNIASLIARTQK